MDVNQSKQSNMNTLLAIDILSEDFLVPFVICVVLPCMIVWMCTKRRRHEIDKKTELAIKAIENGAPLDASLFVPEKKSVKRRIFGYLVAGGIVAGIGLAGLVGGLILQNQFIYLPAIVLLLVGIALLVAYFVGRKQFAAEIAAEEAEIGKK